MRDFSSDELNAVHRNGSFDAPAFSWSLSRYSLFQHCLRAYFLRYYYASGGWDLYADQLVQTAWQEKKVLSSSARLERVFQKTLSAVFTMLRFAPADLRMRVFASRFDLLLDRNLQAEFKKTGDDLAPLRAQISSVLGFLLCSDTFRIILASAPLLTENPASFVFDGIPIWYDPGILWLEENTVCSMRISFSEKQENDQASSNLFALASAQKYPGAGTLSFFIRPNKGAWEENQYEGIARAAADLIRSSSEEMLAKTPDETVSIEDFPPCDDPVKCAFCNFRGTCTLLNT